MIEMKWEDAKKIISNDLVFIDFFTTWCPDCKMMEPVVEEVENIIKTKKINVKFIKVNAEEAKLYAQKDTDFKVKKVPSFYLVNNGIKTHVGYEYLPKEIFIEAIEKANKS